MERRDLLRLMGATAALAILPGEAAAAWARVACGVRGPGGLTEAQLALVGALADAILPRTDTPGAVDVGVPAFVDAVVSGSDREVDREAFVAGLDALAARVGNATGDALGPMIEAIESEHDRRGQPMRTYWRLKSLIVHGYFTSEPVMKQVLHVEVMPGRFDGAAPMPLRRASSDRGDAHA
jgi:glucoside 3-dehydrogenase (cytochrome c) hitch-hiker subunit